MAQRKGLPHIHPGEPLRDELNEIGLRLNELGRALRVPMNRISAIVNGKRAITVDTAMRLGAVLRDVAGVLVERAECVRSGGRGQGIGPRVEREVFAADRGVKLARNGQDTSVE